MASLKIEIQKDGSLACHESVDSNDSVGQIAQLKFFVRKLYDWQREYATGGAIDVEQVTRKDGMMIERLPLKLLDNKKPTKD